MTIRGCQHLVCLGNIDQSNAFNIQHCEMSVPFHGPSGKERLLSIPGLLLHPNQISNQ